MTLEAENGLNNFVERNNDEIKFGCPTMVSRLFRKQFDL